MLVQLIYLLLFQRQVPDLSDTCTLHRARPQGHDIWRYSVALQLNPQIITLPKKDLKK